MLFAWVRMLESRGRMRRIFRGGFWDLKEIWVREFAIICEKSKDFVMFCLAVLKK
jgi:hypothetical protein